ncbi:exodeoxyribonuclease VII large subunit [Mesocricetibacter intestinalis]|uniref:Exodeoxyribonuclease 7 large subunit n=1 Tax=Mesocricetibacter intestinalis TaxID=1521930 RepID=A0A4R6V8V2_9PAST|nr:exodeoxyribonuclease VII large subunit [Mesocricetibacter intestinalis]TDQ57920.1 exodeoxyribonuclease VII large subunit [Mesocricetibacter intestinalis]
MQGENIYSVTRLNQNVRQLLEQQIGLVWLTGEISNFSQPVSGHWYLTLKDESAQVRCAMFRMKNLRVGFKPHNGMQVLVRASVSLYEPRGDYQLIIESMRPAGEGLLQQQFEQLKMKLAAEGLFAHNLKKTLPQFAKSVGIITSRTGAALQDILHILQRRDPSLKIVIYPTAVQGTEAAEEIAAMIELANKRRETDVLIVGRGGGSLEDLWCFNQEIVARAVFASVLPVISAVGHETDVTIMDFVADVRAPTPSAAAELVSRNQAELLQRLKDRRQRLERAMDYLCEAQQRHLNHLLLRLRQRHPQTQLALRQQQIQRLQRLLQLNFERLREKKSLQMTALSRRLYNNPLPYYMGKGQERISLLQTRVNFLGEKILAEERNKLALLCGKLDGLSPLKILARGYSVTLDEAGRGISTAAQVKEGDKIRTRLQQGRLLSLVLEVETEN